MADVQEHRLANPNENLHTGTSGKESNFEFRLFLREPAVKEHLSHNAQAAQDEASALWERKLRDDVAFVL